MKPLILSRLVAQGDMARDVHPDPAVGRQSAHLCQMLGSELLELLGGNLGEAPTPAPVPRHGILPVRVDIAKIIAELLGVHGDVRAARRAQEGTTLFGRRTPYRLRRALSMARMG
jgi:hypothetical protein